MLRSRLVHDVVLHCAFLLLFQFSHSYFIRFFKFIDSQVDFVFLFSSFFFLLSGNIIHLRDFLRTNYIFVSQKTPLAVSGVRIKVTVLGQYQRQDLGYIRFLVKNSEKCYLLGYFFSFYDILQLYSSINFIFSLFFQLLKVCELEKNQAVIVPVVGFMENRPKFQRVLWVLWLSQHIVLLPILLGCAFIVLSQYFFRCLGFLLNLDICTACRTESIRTQSSIQQFQFHIIYDLQHINTIPTFLIKCMIIIIIIKEQQQQQQYQVMQSQTQHPDYVTIVAMSDTHDLHHKIQIQDLPKADIFIHAGDFTRLSLSDELQRFRQFLKNLPYKHKIVIAGNHDFALDKKSYQQKLKNNMHKYHPLDSDVQVKKLKQVCTYLEHQMIEVEGIKIFGSPYSIQFYQWGFMYPQSQSQKLWSTIPKDIDVLVTHGPPFGILDMTTRKQSAGCKGLLKFVQKIKPKIHIFGHIHEAYGHQQVNGINYYNASNVNFGYKLQNAPHLIKVMKNK